MQISPPGHLPGDPDAPREDYLGLAIVSKVIHDHGGVVSVEQTSEMGTVFLIRLPRSQEVWDEAPQRVAM